LKELKYHTNYMASYSNSTYSNGFYDLTGVYFNSTNQSASSSSVDLDQLDARYLIKSSGGTISNNLIVSGSVDIQTFLTIPNIGNVENSLDGKQDLIRDGDLSISKTDGLQTALTGLDELTSSHTTDIATNTADILTKQNNITDGSLTIARTSGLQTALNAKQATITSSTNLSCNSITTQETSTSKICGYNFTKVANVSRMLGGTQSLIAFNSASGNTTYDCGGVLIFAVNGEARGKLTSTGLKLGVHAESPTQMLDVAGNILASGSLTAENLYVGQNTGDAITKSIFFGGTIGDNNYILTVIENRIYEESEKAELLLFKGNDLEGNSGADRIRLRGANIVFDTYPIATTSRTDENIRMLILSNGNVGIGTTTPTALLDVNGDVVVAGDLTAENLIVGSTNVITELTSLDARIDTEEPKTTALQTLTAGHTTDIATNTADILTKQATITTSTYLNCNSMTTNHLEVNNIISTSQFFDTIVVRRPTAINGIGSDRIGVKELQCWVNGVNIMIDNGLTSYFTSWLNKDTDVGPQNASTPSTLAYNNNLDDLGALSTSTEGINGALIIKNLPHTPIHNIQAIVFYSRDTNDTLQTAVGLGIELYNSIKDPNLTTPIASTPVITSTV
jgi:hypothetical protein